jgi:hypothetical protein
MAFCGGENWTRVERPAYPAVGERAAEDTAAAEQPQGSRQSIGRPTVLLTDPIVTGYP